MKRVITGLIAAAGWLLLLFKGSFVLFWILITVLAAIALHEYVAMMVADQPKSIQLTGVAAGLIPPLAAFSGYPSAVAAGMILALLFVLGIGLFRYASFTKPLEFIIRMSFGVAYIGVLSAHLTLIRALAHGPLWLLLLTAITAASDTGAYYTGSTFGKTKLCPSISPGKTVEGFIGGLVAGVAAAILVAAYFFPEISVARVAVVAFVLTCLGVMGDLTESIVKRSAGVKDSGTLLPGHGGMLDRIDSLLITAPALFYLLYFNFFGA